MNRELESIIKDDIERCKKLTTVAGSVELFQALASKYNGYFPGFYDEIIVEGSLTPDGDRDYRPEVHAVQEKLELAILAEHEKDPIYDFRKMLKEDIDKLKNVSCCTCLGARKLFVSRSLSVRMRMTMYSSSLLATASLSCRRTIRRHSLR